MKKPKWVVQKEQDKKQRQMRTVWLFGLHAVRDALMNPNAQAALIVTRNALNKLSERLHESGMEPEMSIRASFRHP